MSVGRKRRRLRRPQVQCLVLGGGGAEAAGWIVAMEWLCTECAVVLGAGGGSGGQGRVLDLLVFIKSFGWCVVEDAAVSTGGDEGEVIVKVDCEVKETAWSLKLTVRRLI